MIDIRYYVDVGGNAPFAEWFAELEPGGERQDCACHCPHGARHFSNAKGVGEGVLECKIDFGPGYRVYFGRDGDTIVILLTGGTKKRQQRDIDAAKAYWRDYRLSKPGRR